MKKYLSFVLCVLFCLSILLLAVSCGETQEPASEAVSSSEEVSSAAGYDYTKPVPKVAGDWAKKSYFSDAAFIGDSVTTGLTLYSYFENATVLAERGIDPANIEEKKISTTNKTIMESLAESKFGKIYIMLGANAAVYMDQAEFIDSYRALIQKIRQLQPDAILYIQAVFPITASLSKENDAQAKGLTNSKIRQYNNGLQELAAQEKIYFVNTFEALADENGELPAEYSSDGIHVNAAQYQNWYDYLRSHVVEVA